MPSRHNLEIDITCPKCQTQHRKALRGLKKNSEFTCRCGAVLRISNDGFTSVQKSIDSLGKTLKKLSR